jgi:prepilin-type N-terminal cleavage/methylation domain-containing protein
MKRRGFTLIELLIAMVILFVLMYMSFMAFSFVNTLSKVNQSREAVLENISTVLDQVTKELRQTYTFNDGTGNFGVKYPTANSTRDIKDISTPTAPLSSAQYYLFGNFDTDPLDDANHPILSFYVVDDSNVEHRISYTLGVLSDGAGYEPPHYKGVQKQYWADTSYEPCEIIYSNEKLVSGSWMIITNQPITDQVITNFAVIRPSWSDKVVQIVIEAMVNDASGKPIKITRIAQVTLRQ